MEQNEKSKPLVSISLVVRNGEQHVRRCLEAVRAQTYPRIETIVFYNESTDRTKEIITREFPEFRLVESGGNYPPGPGWNRSLGLTTGKYFLGLCVDVVMDPSFVARAVQAMEADPSIGALQAKVLVMENGVRTDTIDTTGFEIYRSRRVVNRGHGAKDAGQFEQAGEVFSYEGAVPFWRRTALAKSAVFSQVHDEDFFWYGDDIDLGWRMRLLGWKSWYDPSVVAYHDRSTTKRTSSGWADFIRLRRTIPASKRRLDWQNIHLTFLKNDLLFSSLKDMPRWLIREFLLLCYVIVWEPFVLASLPHMFALLPRMLKKRRYIMRHRKASREEMERWFL